jgi:hypothetical protein
MQEKKLKYSKDSAMKQMKTMKNKFLLVLYKKSNHYLVQVNALFKDIKATNLKGKTTNFSKGFKNYLAKNLGFSLPLKRLEQMAN